MPQSPSTFPRCGAAVPNALAGGACAYRGGPIAGDPWAARALAAQAEAYRQIDEAVAKARAQHDAVVTIEGDCREGCVVAAGDRTYVREPGHLAGN